MRVILRSVLYNILFYLNVLAWLVVAVPTFVLPRRCVIEVAKAWGRSSVWLLRVVCGVKVEWRGQGKWAVKNGPRYLSRTGKWLFLPQRMNWRWCRFPFTEACQWAESTVDDVRCNGMTWTEWQSWVAAKQAAAAP